MKPSTTETVFPPLFAMNTHPGPLAKAMPAGFFPTFTDSLTVGQQEFKTYILPFPSLVRASLRPRMASPVRDYQDLGPCQEAPRWMSSSATKPDLPAERVIA